MTLVFMHNWLIELPIKFDSIRTETLLQVTRGPLRSLFSLVLRTVFEVQGPLIQGSTMVSMSMNALKPGFHMIVNCAIQTGLWLLENDQS